MNLIDALARHYGSDYLSMSQALDAALQEIDALRIEAAQLRAENRYLRRRLRDAELRLMRQAERDAILICAYHMGGLPTSRSACLGYGISRRHWSAAIALLKLGGVHDGRGIVEASSEELAGGLRWALQRCEREGLAPLKARLPRNGYSGRRQSRLQSRN